MEDLKNVTSQTPELVVNLLYSFSVLSYFSTELCKMKGIDAVAASTNGLRWEYCEAGHIPS